MGNGGDYSCNSVGWTILWGHALRWREGVTWRIPRGTVYPSVGQASIAEKQMATCYFPPWRFSSGARFFLRRGIARENNNKEDARTGMEQCASYLARICNFVDDRDKNIDSLFDAVERCLNKAKRRRWKKIDAKFKRWIIKTIYALIFLLDFPWNLNVIGITRTTCLQMICKIVLPA